MARPTARSKKRIAIMFIILIALFVVMAIRTAWIQIVDADGLTEKAINQQTSDLLIEPQRGDILDANGNQLATSVTCYSVWIRPSQIKANYSDAEIKELSQKLANIIGSTTEKIQKYIQRDIILWKPPHPIYSEV